MRNKKNIWIIITALIVVEQGIKIVINSRYLDENLPILNPWIYFSPMFNRSYSWFNSMLQLGIGKWAHVIIVTVMLILIYLFYKFLNQRSKTTRLVDAAFAFIFAGAACSWIDKVFWNGSLDYIALKGLFTFDLKDVYINIFNGLLILMILTNHKGFRQMDDKEILKDFIRFLRRR